MKKRFSTLTVGVIAFLMLATGVAASSYYHWAGSENFDESMNTMDKVQYGIGLLMGDLEKEEQAHESTQNELNELKKTIKEATGEEEGTITDLINERNTLKSDLETVTSNRNKLQENLNLIAKKTSDHIAEINEIPGAGPKYSYLVNNVNKDIEYLYTYSDDIVATDKKLLNDTPGNGPTNNALIQATKDMKDVKDKSDDTLKVFSPQIQAEIKSDFENEENTEIKYKDYTPGEEGKKELNQQ